ncbi:tetratricopeptide repeat protein [Flammeovirga yaeyamensis]|uniref:histidine kinase n=1 Tax=Flammeovirga yaeyamensis TaxID=367791 RepID=A0AAX1N7R9_9BACT|nr:tetratricopeptide repeat protein [Flammeovirga yaeyamensis]MBB3699761.1 PAS domain S-box-containing protein [Flammeovirga yaeyamensis]NMF36670.1 tetratricopeptide repeat protein [Flammeovirga yaeyamensis]QWG02285.1 tetratricopeptide repeat protein [Flammeovirga yaeyamensis]
MNWKNKYFLISILLLLMSNVSICQTETDSLWDVWTDLKAEDTTRLEALLQFGGEMAKTNSDSVLILSEMGYQYALENNLLNYQAKALNLKAKTLYRKGEYDDSEEIYNQAIILGRKAEDSLLVATSFQGIGTVYYARGEYETSIDYYQKSYAISSILNDNILMGDVMNNIGIINVIQKDYERAEKSLKKCDSLYMAAGDQRSAPLTNLAVLKFRKGDLIQSMELYLQAVRINEKNGDDYSNAFAYSNIANIYFDLNDFERYEEYINKSLEIRRKLGDKAGILNNTLNLGLGYSNEDQYEKALPILEESLALAKEIDDKNSEAHILVHLAFLQVKLNETENTLATINDALNINKKLGNQLGIALCNKAYGNYYKIKGNNSKALIYYKKGLKIAKETDLEQTKDISEKIYEIYKMQNNSTEALKAFELFVTSKDSVHNLETQKVVLHQQYKYENDKRALSDSLNYASQQQIQQEKLIQSKNQKTALIIILALVTIFTIFAINRVLLIRSQKKIIEGQVVELNELNENLEEKVIERSQKIADREEQLRYALEASNDGIWDWKVKSDRMIFSPALYTMLGYVPYEFEETREEIQNRIHLDDLKKIEADSYLDLILQSKEGNLITEARLKNKFGKYIWVQIKGKVVSRDNIGNPDRVVGTFTDITSIKQKAQDILNAVMTTEDIERNRISKDIHDGLQQTLTVSSLNFQKVRKSIDDLPAEVIETFGIGYDYLQKSINESRHVAHNLMPKAIVDFGIIKAFEDLIYEVDKSTDSIEFEFFHNFGEHQINNQQVRLTLYRILQEGINNIFKYSKATKVDIQLKNYEDIYMLTIEDNGVGFDAEKVLKEESGLGFKGMKNRLDAIGGFLEIESKEGRGTTLVIEINKNF